jgi:8-oxo-dGTP pyrophosphatase MutT (NUDIX family)
MKVSALLYESSSLNFLCGLESYYCFEDSIYPNENKYLHSLEFCSENKAINTSIKLSDYFDIEIRYTEFNKEGRTHFCCLTSNSHLGIIKGNVEPHEEPIVAMQREIKEEVGINVPLSRLISYGFLQRRTILYLVPLSQKEIIDIKERIEERKKRHCGEIFQLDFRTLDESTHNMNQITRKVQEWLKEKHLPILTEPYESITMDPLLPLTVLSKETYNYNYIEEEPFVWNKIRYSLLPIPSHL